MLKKVSGAKDKLKQHLHAPHASSSSSSSKPRSHRSRSHPHRHQTPQAMSFSAMDNAAFEQILSDDTDFLVDFEKPPRPPPPAIQPPQPAPQRASSIPSDPSDPSALDEESDLFDADMFVVLDEPTPEANDADNHDADPLSSSSSSSSQAVKCDPLSGQIVAQSIPSGVGTGNGTDPGKETDSGQDSQHEHTESQDDDLFPNDEQLLNASTKKDEDGNGHQSLPHPLAATLSESPPPQQWDFAHSLEQGHPIAPHLLSADTSATAVVSSSLPPNLETSTTTLRTRSESAPRSNPLPRKNPTSPPPPPPPPWENSESFPSDIKSELEQLLAPRKAPPIASGNPAVPSNSAGGSGGGGVAHQLRVTQRGVSAEREGSHLDSGVFEHEGRDLDCCTPDQDREGGTGARKSRKEGEKLPPMRDNHFKAEPASSSSSSAADSKSSDAQSAKVSPDQVVVKKNSVGKTPPPRPPLSPQVHRRMKSSPKLLSPPHQTASSACGTGTDEVVPKLVQPLGAARGNATLPPETAVGVVRGGAKQQGESGEPLSDAEDDDLFPNDTKKMRELEENMALAMRESDNSNSSPIPPPAAPPRLENSTPSPHPHTATTATDRETDKVTTEEKPTSLSTTTSDRQQPETEEADFPPSVHLLLSLALYLYYSLNIFPYLAGLFAGFLMLYIFLGSVFVYYVQAIEREREDKKEQRRNVSVSDDFVQSMKVDFNKLKEYKVHIQWGPL